MKPKGAGVLFEREFMASLDWTVRYTEGAFGMTIRRRMARGSKGVSGGRSGVSQGFDLLHLSSLAALLIECKSLTLERGADTEGYKGRFYLDRNIKRSQVMWFLEHAFGMGIPPFYAFMCHWESSQVRDAYLVDAEDVIRYLLSYSYISIPQMQDDGVFAPRFHASDGEKRVHLYEISKEELQEAIRKFVLKLGQKDSAIREWLKGERENGPLPMNCKRFLESGRVPVMEVRDGR